MFFASDNAGIAHPKVMTALTQANVGYALGYGRDALTQQVTAELRALFEAPEAAVYLVPTGTAANALALACLARPFDTVFCAPQAHIQEDECGAPEFYSGAKLTLVGDGDKIDPSQLQQEIARCQARGFQGVKPGALSLSQVTEFGQIYRLDEIRALTDVARTAGLPTHMDGARFGHACAALGVSPADMTWRVGVDAVSFGATKNGCLGVEAVVLFDPNRAAEFEARRKRGGHLLSKHRYLAAQMQAYLAEGLWLELAQQANAKARYLANQLARINGITLAYPVEANMIFARVPRPLLERAISGGAVVSVIKDDANLPLVRLVCDWAQPESEIAQFLDLLA
ncbi:beta-eliminating lyase-related protein [Cognatishimia sp. SS12]|uniref:threonine aldolase family protein n=1 Tax=Cognatishimia sp. SS12 TaxID=2979465 RepID=UPI00232BB966|nr:beta-eliminating lyase-related protein [Cognatishimia sp. SS12]MDC0738190.1 beta-eliminating lyase-related protein [Cognatishimia sp. SS12]